MFPPFLFSILISLIIIGLVLWLVNFLPVDATFKQVIRVVVIVCVVIWILYMLMGASPGPYPFHR
jgi:hypothetical protein